MMEQLNLKYVIKDPESVSKFLSDNLDLIDILMEAPDYIYSIFGNVSIHLELYRDPEEDNEELFIVIKTKLTPKEAIVLEQILFEKWFVNVMEKVGKRLNFMEEFDTS